jgi:hypothetical protein
MSAHGSQVGAERRSRPEGYPKDQARQPELQRSERQAGAARERASLRGGGVATDDAPAAPYSTEPATGVLSNWQAIERFTPQ